MFGVEIAAGVVSDSVSLLADAVDFLGDAGNYAITLVVMPLGLLWRARAAWVKGLTKAAFGAFVLGKALFAALSGSSPEPAIMGAVGVAALTANVTVAIMLYRFRSGDANMRSVWLCSRNDAIGNLAVMLAALGVFGTGSAWPDFVVAGIMAGLALTAAASVMKQSWREMAHARALPHVSVSSS
jgi:Co/Zn/Cd efflux system component